MPFTLFHYPFGYWLSKIDRKLVLPALLVGSVIPDIEVPILFFFFSGIVTDHFILHSLIGSLTIGLVLAVLTTRYVYPTLISRLFRLPKNELDELCGVTPNLIVSCAIGILFHLIADYPIHWYNHLLWPWVDPFLLVGPLAILVSSILSTDIVTGYLISGTISGVVLGVSLIYIAIRNRDGLWRRMWIGN